jgi:hypothetical protein
MIRTRLASTVILICALVVGCRNRRAPSLGVTDSTFVAALRDLRRIQADSSLDTTMKDSSRRMILRRYNVTSAQLEHAARVLAESPVHASDLWRQIETASRPPVAKATAPISGPPPSNNHPVPRP